MALSTLSRNLTARVLGELGGSGTTIYGPEHPLLELGLLGSSGNSGTRGPLFIAPNTLFQNLVFSDLGEIIPEGGATWQSTVLASGLGNPWFPCHRQQPCLVSCAMLR